MPLTAAQMAARRTGLGSSDAAVVVGLSPWTSRFDLFLDKVLGRPGQSESEAMRWGNLLEEPIAVEVAARTGLDLAYSVETFRHADRPWMLAHIDRLVLEAGCIVAVLEIKTASRRAAEEWGPSGTDRIPLHYVPQVAHQMAVLDVPRCHVAALLNGCELRTYTVPRDLVLEQILLEEEAAFWWHVENQVPPEPDGAASAAEWIRSWHARPQDEVLAAPPELEQLAEERRELASRIAELERLKTAMEDTFPAVIGPCAGIAGRYGKTTWTPDSRGVRALRWTFNSEDTE